MLNQTTLTAKVTLIAAVLAILGASLAPATAFAHHKRGKGVRVGGYFIYAAIDTSKHPVPECPGLSGRTHLNINVKRNERDPDRHALLRIHVSPPDKKGRVWLYEPNTKTCKRTKFVYKQIRRLFKKENLKASARVIGAVFARIVAAFGVAAVAAGGVMAGGVMAGGVMVPLFINYCTLPPSLYELLERMGICKDGWPAGLTDSQGQSIALPLVVPQDTWVRRMQLV